MSWNIYHGDCREVMQTLHPENVDSIVCDPPYGLSFMGKEWDSFKEGDIAMRRNPQMDAVNTGASRQGGRQRACADYQKRQARDMLAFQEAMNAVFLEALRVAKPGAHLLAFGGTRTYHRLACAIEDAGWEIRDCVMWVYGSGFPKSHDVSKAIDKAAGAEREVVGVTHRTRGICGEMAAAVRCSVCGKTRNGTSCKCDPDNGPATDAARQWSGWGTALKPAWEPIIVARKPLCGTVAENVLKHGTGGINVDGCRVGGEPSPSAAMRASGRVPSSCKPGEYGDTIQNRITPERWAEARAGEQLGRWPANVIHDGSDEVVGLFPASSGKGGDSSGSTALGQGSGWNAHNNVATPIERRNDSGSAARFFYCAKASKADRDADNHHPTVKPTALMRYLCRLVTPPGGVVLDPFTGSGSTGKAAIMEGFRFIGIEREAEYVEIAKARIGAAEAGAGPLFSKCAIH